MLNKCNRSKSITVHECTEVSLMETRFNDAKAPYTLHDSEERKMFRFSASTYFL